MVEHRQETSVLPAKDDRQTVNKRTKMNPLAPSPFSVADPAEMATFYTIHATSQEWEEEMTDTYDLYTTFEKACDAMDKLVQEYVDNYNNEVRRAYDEEIVFEKPDRAALAEHLKTWRSVRYYRLETPSEPDVLFIIRRLTVVS